MDFKEKRNCSGSEESCCRQENVQQVVLHRDDQFLNFMRKTGSYQLRDYSFCYDLEAGRVLMEYLGGQSSLTDHGYVSQTELEEYLKDNNLDNLRFCSICGAPMQSGYTDEDIYIDTDLEFRGYMNQTYGDGKWRAEPTGGKEWNYEYLDEEPGIWRPSPFYWTEW